MEDNTFLAPLSPIQRSTSSQRLDLFKSKERAIYNSISPYYQAGGGIGPNQPFVYTKLTDSNSAKSFTSRDTQAVPFGSVTRDLIRMGKFTVTGNGLLYIGKQTLLQGSAPFDETRTYNLGSVIAATSSPLSGNRPTRHIEGRGGLLNFFAGALLSTLGFSTTKENSTSPIAGTATGQLPSYVQARGSGRYGVMRGETASGGVANFNKIWVGASASGKKSGFLSSVMRAVASTTGLFSNSGRPATWAYRPEYGHDSMIVDPYTSMLILDKRKLLSYTGVKPLYGTATGKFYNDSRDPLNYTELVKRRQARQASQDKVYEEEFISNVDGTQPTTKVTDDGADLETTVSPIQLMKSFPDTNGKDFRYASPQTMNERAEKDKSYELGLTGLYKRMFDLVEGQNTELQHPMYNKSAERYNTLNRAIDGKNISEITVSNNYKAIPDNGSVNFSENDVITIDKRTFAQSSTTKTDRFGKKTIEQGDHDKYNALGILSDQQELSVNSDQSKDLIFFYFQDLINKKYIPFRATLGGISDQHSAEWDTISYLGRADKLFVYKGFTRDVNFNFKVYANSIHELIPMWERVNYLAGLVRPSKYTDPATITNETALATNEVDAIFGFEPSITTTGKESSFIYPPMITFRIGDMYVDQPAVLGSVSITIPDDATWETLRADNYEYYYGIDKVINKNGARSRQLPNIIDVSVSLKLLEKQRAETKNYHFGPQEGWENKL